MYKVGNTIDVIYQAKNASSGAIAVMEVYDEGYAFVSKSTMTELGSTGRYYDSFVPDAEGTWITLLYEEVGAQMKGHVVKAHKVGSHDIDTVGDKVDTNLDQSLSTTEDNIRGADNDDLKTLSDQIDAIESPAMVG